MPCNWLLPSWMMVSPRGEVGGEWESYSEAEGESSSVTQVYMNVYMTSGKSHAFPWKPTIRNGEGGIRTHGADNRTTAFETAPHRRYTRVAR